MKVLYEENYERPGNDYWLHDKIQIIVEDEDLILRHKVKHDGWNGPIRETTEINLDEFSDTKSKQERVKQYMENVMLTPEMKVPNLYQILGEEEEGADEKFLQTEN